MQSTTPLTAPQGINPTAHVPTAPLSDDICLLVCELLSRADVSRLMRTETRLYKLIAWDRPTWLSAIKRQQPAFFEELEPKFEEQRPYDFCKAVDVRVQENIVQNVRNSRCEPIPVCELGRDVERILKAGDYLCVVRSNGEVSLCSSDGKKIRVFEKSVRWVQQLEIHGDLVCMRNKSGVVTVWNIQTGHYFHKFSDVPFRVHGNALVTLYSSLSTLCFWNLQTGVRTEQLKDPVGEKIAHFAFYGSCILFHTDKGQTVSYDPATKETEIIHVLSQPEELLEFKVVGDRLFFCTETELSRRTLGKIPCGMEYTIVDLIEKKQVGKSITNRQECLKSNCGYSLVPMFYGSSSHLWVHTLPSPHSFGSILHGSPGKPAHVDCFSVEGTCCYTYSKVSGWLEVWDLSAPCASPYSFKTLDSAQRVLDKIREAIEQKQLGVAEMWAKQFPIKEFGEFELNATHIEWVQAMLAIELLFHAIHGSESREDMPPLIEKLGRYAPLVWRILDDILGPEWRDGEAAKTFCDLTSPKIYIANRRMALRVLKEGMAEAIRAGQNMYFADSYKAFEE